MSLAVTTTGNGPDLALIHGWGFPAAVWAPLLPRLAERFRVHCIDLPGYGGSRAEAPGTIQATADAVIAALPSALPAGVTLCGWSLGAQVAIAALARHSRVVRGLVLVASTPCFLNRPDWTHGVDPALLELFAAGLQRNPTAVLGRFAALLNQGEAQARDLTRRLAELAAAPPETSALVAGLAQLRDLDLRPVLAKISQPVLLIHGDHDPLMPTAAARWAADALPAGHLEVLAGAAHAPFLSQPERFVDLLVAEVGRAAPTPC